MGFFYSKSDAPPLQQIRPPNGSPSSHATNSRMSSVGPPGPPSQPGSAMNTGTSQLTASFPPASGTASGAHPMPNTQQTSWYGHTNPYPGHPPGYPTPPGYTPSNATSSPPGYNVPPPSIPHTYSQGPPPAPVKPSEPQSSFWRSFIDSRKATGSTMGPSWAHTALTTGIGAAAFAARGYLGDTITSALCGATLLGSLAWTGLSDVSQANTPSEMQKSSWSRIGANYLTRAKAGDQMTCTARAASLLGYSAFGGSPFSPGALIVSSVAAQGARLCSAAASNQSTHPS